MALSKALNKEREANAASVAELKQKHHGVVVAMQEALDAKEKERAEQMRALTPEVAKTVLIRTLTLFVSYKIRIITGRGAHQSQQSCII